MEFFNAFERERERGTWPFPQGKTGSCGFEVHYSVVQINVVNGCAHHVFSHATFDHVHLDSRVEAAAGHGHVRRPILGESIPTGGNIAKKPLTAAAVVFPCNFGAAQT